MAASRESGEPLGGLDPPTLTEFGHLQETFVVGELRKQAARLDQPVTVGHWPHRPPGKEHESD